MHIRKYNKTTDESGLMRMIEEEEGWDYANESMAPKYKAALESAITYVACEGDELCGYSRSVRDCEFYIYVYDLLVKPAFRGRGIGRKLMECLHNDYPDHAVYVMSGVDGYYDRIGYKRAGSIFEVPKTRQPPTRTATTRGRSIRQTSRPPSPLDGCSWAGGGRNRPLSSSAAVDSGPKACHSPRAPC